MKKIISTLMFGSFALFSRAAAPVPDEQTAGNNNVFAVYFSDSKILYCDHYSTTVADGKTIFQFSGIKGKDLASSGDGGANTLKGTATAGNAGMGLQSEPGIAQMIYALSGGISVSDNGDNTYQAQIDPTGIGQMRIYAINQEAIQSVICLNDDQGTVLYGNQAYRTYEIGEFGAMIRGDLKMGHDASMLEFFHHLEEAPAIQGVDPHAGPPGDPKILQYSADTWIIKCIGTRHVCFWVRKFNPEGALNKW